MTKILLVDDMIELLEEEMELLEESGFGYQVKSTPSPEQALRWLETERFDLIVLDIRMPKIDGFEILREVKNKYHTPVIIYSAYVDEEMRRRLDELGADIILTKPAPPDLFLHSVLMVLEPQAKTSFVMVDGFKVERIQNSVLERRLQEALARIQGQGNLHHAAVSLNMSDEYLSLLLKKFRLI